MCTKTIVPEVDVPFAARGKNAQCDLHQSGQLAVDKFGNLFTCDASNGALHYIRAVHSPASVTLLSANEPGPATDGPCVLGAAAFSSPSAIVYQRLGPLAVLVIADTGNNRVRLIFINEDAPSKSQAHCITFTDLPAE